MWVAAGISHDCLALHCLQTSAKIEAENHSAEHERSTHFLSEGFGLGTEHWLKKEYKPMEAKTFNPF